MQSSNYGTQLIAYPFLDDFLALDGVGVEEVAATQQIALNLLLRVHNLLARTNQHLQRTRAKLNANMQAAISANPNDS